jgi:hypothetical protein
MIDLRSEGGAIGLSSSEVGKFCACKENQQCYVGAGKTLRWKAHQKQGSSQEELLQILLNR